MNQHMAEWTSVPKTGSLQKRKLLKVVDTLLLVDGNDDSRASLKFLLELHGYRVTEARHGIEGLQVLCEWAGDIQMALCAPELPDMTGGEWMGQLRFLGPEIPALLLTDREMVEATDLPVGHAYAGMTATPPGPTRLLARIRNALDENFFAYCARASAA